jgi:Ca2+-binding RTX toxin-like protein
MAIKYGDTVGTYYGSQTIYGTDAIDTIYGDVYTLQTNGGHDTLYGGLGGDTLFGDAYYVNTKLGGNDKLFGEDATTSSTAMAMT